MRFGSKKENACKQELEVCSEVMMSSVMESEVTGETPEAWKLYILPEIPQVPLSGHFLHFLNSFIGKGKGWVFKASHIFQFSW